MADGLQISDEEREAMDALVPGLSDFFTENDERWRGIDSRINEIADRMEKAVDKMVRDREIAQGMAEALRTFLTWVDAKPGVTSGPLADQARRALKAYDERKGESGVE